MNYLASNIRYLRKQNNLTQEMFSIVLKINRSMIGAYEEGRAVPRISVLQAISVYFSISLDDLINQDLSALSLAECGQARRADNGSRLRVLATVVDNTNRELITVVPMKASAGYLNGYADPEYVGQLPRFTLPLPELAGERTRRVFQIRGDSMLPLQPGTYILCDYLQDWAELKDGETYILITLDEGVVYKRVYSKVAPENSLTLKSDNPDYESYSVALSNICEIWKAVGTMNFNLRQPTSQQGSVNKKHSTGAEPGLHEIAALVMEMRKELDELKSNVR